MTFITLRSYLKTCAFCFEFGTRIPQTNDKSTRGLRSSTRTENTRKRFDRVCAARDPTGFRSGFNRPSGLCEYQGHSWRERDNGLYRTFPPPAARFTPLSQKARRRAPFTADFSFPGLFFMYTFIYSFSRRLSYGDSPLRTDRIQRRDNV